MRRVNWGLRWTEIGVEYRTSRAAGTLYTCPRRQYLSHEQSEVEVA